MVEREYREGVYLAIGHDSVTGKFRNRAIEVNSRNLTNDRELEREVQQKVYFSYEHITDEKMLVNSLDLSGSGFKKAQTGFDFSDTGWSAQANAKVSFSAKAKFVANRNWKSSHTYILVKCLVENDKYRIKNPSLTNEAKKILEGKNSVANFREKFGDEFIVGFSTGGEYCALIEASSFDTQSQSSLVADVRAEMEHYVQKLNFKAEHGMGIDISAKRDHFQRNKKTNFEVSVYRAGCEDIGHAFVMSIEQIVEEISTLPAYVKKTGGIKFASIFSDYGTIIGDRNSEIMGIESTRLKNTIADLAEKKQKDSGELLKIEQQLENVNYESQSLTEKRNEITRRMYEINKYARQCIQNPRLIDDDLLRDLITWN